MGKVPVRYTQTGEHSGKEKQMRHLRELANKFRKDEKGLETVEYAIIAGLIVVGTIGLLASIGGWVYSKFNALDQGLAANP